MDRLLEATARAEQQHFWWRGFRAFVRPALERAAAGRRVRILDCGCGTGANLPLLRQFGTATGIDLTWSGLSFARARGERRVAQARADALPFADGTFDLVTSFDMLQCLPDPVERAALAEMRRVLGPGGHLVVNVAALDLLWGNHSILAREVRRYTKQQLSDRLEAAGFAPLRVTYTNAVLFPILAPLRLAQRAMGLATSDLDEKAQQEVGIPPAPVNAALTALLRLESAALRLVNMPVGSSLLGIATVGSGLERPV
ncbi:MAG TPA: methyltransferase domain-containing protein [Vicinamibacterales bacterium]|nr:methyltransferase domain-containing protein [Vicinamibacterales bacterium]